MACGIIIKIKEVIELLAQSAKPLVLVYYLFKVKRFWHKTMNRFFVAKNNNHKYLINYINT